MNGNFADRINYAVGTAFEWIVGKVIAAFKGDAA